MRVLAQILGLLIALSPSVVSSSQATRRVVRMSVLPVNAPKDVQPSQVTTPEGEAGSVHVEGLGQFGFTPRLQAGNDKTVIVVITSLAKSPPQELGRIDVTVGGKPVKSKTTPSFEVQVISVTSPKY